jgi:hypothetical protein
MAVNSSTAGVPSFQGRVTESITLPEGRFAGVGGEPYKNHQESCSIVFMAQSHREASRRLFDLAEQQQGFFTTKQAKAAGFAENTHPYHVQAGNWIREHRGIYRLTLFPTPDRPDLITTS